MWRIHNYSCIDAALRCARVSKLLFNINDLALILVATACLMHALALFIHRTHTAKILLALFLCCTAARALDTLFYWSTAVKAELMPLAPHIFFVLKVSFFIEPVLLYFFTRSVIYFDQKITRIDMLHFIPALIFACAVPFIYHTLGAKLPEALLDYQILDNNWIFSAAISWAKVSYVLYAAISFRLLLAHRSRLQDTTSNTEGIDANWLMLLVGGFLVLWSYRGFGQIFTQFGFHWIPDILGVSANWLMFLLINTLVFLGLTRAANVKQQSTRDILHHEPPAHFTEEQIARLEKVMRTKKAYLDPELSLEQLSTMTSLPQKLLSAIINRHMGRNFFEYVNYYRVLHAKALLESSNNSLSMLDIMAESGFNSKSAFNRFFKKFSDRTPTQYKAMMAASPTSAEPILPPRGIEGH